MDDLHLGDGMTEVFPELGKGLKGMPRDIFIGRHPASALSDKAKEEGTAAVDILKADLDGFEILL